MRCGQFAGLRSRFAFLRATVSARGTFAIGCGHELTARWNHMAGKSRRPRQNSKLPYALQSMSQPAESRLPFPWRRSRELWRWFREGVARLHPIHYGHERSSAADWLRRCESRQALRPRCRTPPRRTPRCRVPSAGSQARLGRLRRLLFSRACYSCRPRMLPGL